jgi:hypothetical protein
VIAARLLAILVASAIAFPAVAQTSTDTEKNGHHYSGGPKTEVPHHMGKKKTTTGTAAKPTSDGGHHYGGGPKTESHHMGTKQ